MLSADFQRSVERRNQKNKKAVQLDKRSPGSPTDEEKEMPRQVLSERADSSLVGEGFPSNTQSQQLLAPHLT